MTVEAFNEIHGLEWLKFKNKPIFMALRAVMAAHSPAKLNAKRPPLDVLNAGNLMFAENQGYEQLVEIIEAKLGAAIAKPESIESDYSESPLK